MFVKIRSDSRGKADGEHSFKVVMFRNFWEPFIRAMGGQGGGSKKIE